MAESVLTQRLKMLSDIKNGTAKQKPPAIAKTRPSFLSPAQQVPPWANPDCAACAGYGFSSEKRPCRICSGNAARLGKPSGDKFYVEEIDGVLVWELLGAAPEAPAPSMSEKMGVDLDNADENPFEAPDPEEGEAVDVSLDSPPAEAPPAPAPEAPAPKRRGRPPGSKNKEKPPAVVAPTLALAPESEGAVAGFTLKAPPVDQAARSLTLIVNAQVSSVGPLVSLEGIFKTYSEALASALGVPSYYSIPAGTRRDTLAAAAGAVAAIHNGQTIVGRMDTFDMVNFVAALRPFCTCYVEGTGAAL